ncbi:MAG: YicC family protein [Alcaligenaceae bacterium]|nr:YicC family protein [Alcaligenaceae bacterium]
MIQSMTAFGSAQTESELGSITVELKSVNSRYLDLNFRIPDELRQTENGLRELLTGKINRGKLEVRVSFIKNQAGTALSIEPELLKDIATLLADVRAVLPETETPKLIDLVTWPSQKAKPDSGTEWQVQCLETARLAIEEFITARLREGERLGSAMKDYAKAMADIVKKVEAILPDIHAEYRTKLATKLQETLEAACPNGLQHLSGEELSTRIASESALFSLRIDVAEEITRLHSHLKELQLLLEGKTKNNKQSTGKRLDFLFQEMNREVNTLGSKSSSLEITQAVIDLKLYIEQLREQAQNIE